MPIGNIEELRAAKASGALLELARESLVSTLGERARTAAETPATTAILERYAEAWMALAEAAAAFNYTAAEAEALSVAALAYRDARLQLDARCERIMSEALGLVEH